MKNFYPSALRSNFSAVADRAHMKVTPKNRWELARRLPNGVRNAQKYDEAVAKHREFVNNARQPAEVKKTILLKKIHRGYKLVGHGVSFPNMAQIHAFAADKGYVRLRIGDKFSAVKN